MNAHRADYMEAFCKSGVVKSYDASLDQAALVPGFALSDSCLQTIEALNL